MMLVIVSEWCEVFEVMCVLRLCVYLESKDAPRMVKGGRDGR